MQTNDYFLPGIAAIALAILAPLYWMFEIGISVSTGEPRSDWGMLDAIFILIGVLQVYVYYSLKQMLHDHHEFHGADLVLNLLIASVVVYHISMMLIGSFGSEGALIIALVVSMIIVGILDIIFAVILISGRSQFANTLNIYAIATLVLGVFEVTVVFSLAAPFIYAVTAIALAVHFLRKPETVEFV